MRSTEPPGPTRRTVTTLRNLAILARVGVHHFEDDPALLAVQTLRRLPPPARRALAVAVRTATSAGSASGGSTGGGAGGRATLGEAFAEYVSDRPEPAREALARSTPRGRAGRRLHAELAVALGGPPPDQAPAAVVARSLWNRGCIGEAVEALPAEARGALGRQRDRLASERRILEPGFRLDPPKRPASPPTGAPRGADPAAPRALHLLTNSLPWTQSGYSLRSHAVLRSQAASGIPVRAVTRVGYPVTVGLPHAAEVDVVDGVPYRRLLPWSMADTQERRLAQTAELLLHEADAFGATVLHTTTHYPNAVVASAVAERAGVPWVYEVRGQLEKTWAASRPVAQRDAAHASERFALWHAREAELAAAADHVVTLSRALADDLEARGVPRERITIVPNAVDDSLVDDAQEPVTPADARRALGLPADGFWVGTVTSVVDYEGLDVLLEAVALLRRDGVDARCAVVGDGVARPALLGLADRLGLADAVVMPGRVPRDEAAAWHRALDVFVVPRRDLEVCRTVTPLKPIEAMALGRPVVASDLPALAEITAEPGTGLTFAAESPDALATTLQSLHADPDLGSGLAERGRRFAATRTWRAQAAAYRTIYERLGTRA